MFGGLFTQENVSKIPTHATVKDLNIDRILGTIDIRVTEVETILHELYTKKSMGHDTMHPFLLFLFV